ncbi:MAG: DUF2452 domain-containing protein [Halioglobus sp.]
MATTISSTQKNPNPQGKGCVPVLQDWHALSRSSPVKKSASDILTDYCFSALVLAAKFRFRPVLGKTYYLYSEEQEWSLSLIGPQEWGDSIPGEFVGNCRLQTDMTWQLEFGQLHTDSPVSNRLKDFVEGFAHALARQESVLDELPFYVSDLPYYQRMLATGLAVSLQHSIKETGTVALTQELLFIKRDAARYLRASGELHAFLSSPQYSPS